MNHIESYLKKIDPDLDKIVDSDPKFAAVLNPFIEEVRIGYETLSNKKLTIRNCYKEICITFGEDHIRTKPEDIVESLSYFIKKFTILLSEYRRKHEREALAKQRRKVIY